MIARYSGARLATLVCFATLALSVGSVQAADDPLVAKAKALVEQATTGLVAPADARKPELDNTIEDFASAQGWAGVGQSKAAPEKKKVAVIACATVAPFCANVARGAVEAAEALGWDATYIDGKASIEGYVQAFETAINMSPDGIITMAVPESQLASQIAKARAAGIKVIGASAIPEQVSVEGGQYDAYVSVREDTTSLLQAWYVIADSDGTAKVAWLWDPGYPFLVAAMEKQKEIIAACKGCEVQEIAFREFATAADPVRMQQLALGLLNRNPTVEYILVPYGLNAQSIALAARTLGRDVKVVSKNADPNNIALVSQGVLNAEIGASSVWGGWAAVDQLVRLLAGDKPLEIMEQNQPVRLFVEANAPANGEFDFTQLIDFKKSYLKLWGRR